MIKGHIWGQNINFKVKWRKYDFKLIKLVTCVIPIFRVILTEKSFSSIILVILGDPQRQKVNFKDKYDFWNIC